jgi:hypothetical protein
VELGAELVAVLRREGQSGADLVGDPPDQASAALTGIGLPRQQPSPSGNSR